MTLSISQLKTPPTREEIVAWMIERATELGFQTTGWQEGGIAHTMLNIAATGVSLMVPVSADIVRSFYNETATGAGLELVALNNFNNTPESAVQAAGPFLFTNSGTVAHAVVVGQLLIQDANGVEFSNTSAGTIPAGGTFELDMIAALAGNDGNIANGAALTMITPLAGVVASNPGPGDVDLDGFDDPWQTIATGADPETNIELQARNASQWGLLSIEKTATGVKNLALSQTGVSKAKVIHDNPRGAGTVDVYVASGGDLVSEDDKETAQGNFADYFMGTTSTYPPEAVSRYHILDPPEQELEVLGDVFFDPQYTQAAVEANVAQGLDDFVSLMPIGGVEYISGSGLVTLGDLLEVLENTAGVRSVTINTPSGNTSVASTTLITAPADWITGKLTFVAVTS